ncbi:MAG: hypothetical protein KGJ86_22865, partial [Chloroflexota bacterium]|nr:hypothetical protein [Chloroflexota bacterium]
GSHIYVNEVGGTAAIGGLHPRPLPDSDGCLKPNDVEAAVRTENIHYPSTGLICLENTHNVAGGTVTPLAGMEAVVSVARSHGLKMHLDGARLFNASAFLGAPASKLAAPFDSVYICLSKGLAAPVGSLTVGSAEFVAAARKYRKMLGGGMRQAGVIAAAGIVALTQMVQRLPEDHRTARRIAEALHELPGISLDLAKVQTNIVRFGIVRPGLTAAMVSQQLRELGVLINPTGPQSMRLVTHYQVGATQVEAIVAAFRRVLAG